MVVQQVVLVVGDFAEELLVGCFKQFFERRIV